MPDSSNNATVTPEPDPGKPEETALGERRRTKRYPFVAKAEVVELNSRVGITGRCSDLGCGGCFVDTLSSFVVGSKVRVRIEHGARVFETAAAVVYAQESMGMGLAFSEMKPEHAAVLRYWITELTGENPPETTPVPVQQAAAPEPQVPDAEAEGIRGTEILGHVLAELIHLMVRRKTITEKEAAMLLRQLPR